MQSLEIPDTSPPEYIPTLNVEPVGSDVSWSYSNLLNGLRSFATSDDSGATSMASAIERISSAGEVISTSTTRLNDIVVENDTLYYAPIGRYSNWRNISFEKEIDFGASVKIIDLVHVADAFLVSLADVAELSDLENFLEQYGVTVLRTLYNPKYIVISVNIDDFNIVIDAAAENKDLFSSVSLLEPIISLATTANDTYFNNQWYLTAQGNDSDIDATLGWDVRTSAGSVRVAVLDSGIRYTHDDIDGNIINQYDFVDNDGDPSSPTNNHHGTWVSGIIGAEGNNSQGVAGVAWDIDMLVARVNTSDDVIDAIDWASSNGAKIINMSFYFSSHYTDIYDEIAEKSNILFVCAAGNDGNNIDTYFSTILLNGFPILNYYPARYDLSNIITVSGSDQDNDPWYHDSSYLTNTGVTHIDIAAPADTVWGPGANNDADYVAISGTSASTPLVSGTAALVMAQYPNQSITYYKNRIIHSAKERSGLNTIAPEGRLLSLYNALTLGARWWMNDVDFGNGQKWNAMGFFYKLSPSGWIYHFDIGWLYSTSTSSNDVYFWDPVTGYWVYTGNSFYPFFQVYPTSGPNYTVWYNENNTPHFYNFNTSSYQSTF